MTASTSTQGPRLDPRHLWWAAAVFLGIMSAIALWYGPKLTPQPEIRAPLSACDLGKSPCSTELPGGGRVTLDIGPRPIPVMQQIEIVAQLDGLDADRVEVDFAGVDMNMGFNRFVLIDDGQGNYRGNGVLPVCVRTRMDWEATIFAETGRGLVAAPFRFETVRR